MCRPAGAMTAEQHGQDRWCRTCEGAPRSPWAADRRAAAALVGPHPTATDFRCPRCSAPPTSPCVGRVREAHAGRLDRGLRAAELFHLVSLSLADAAGDQRTGRSPDRAARDAGGRLRRLVRVTEGTGVVYALPSVEDVLAASEAGPGPEPAG